MKIRSASDAAWALLYYGCFTVIGTLLQRLGVDALRLRRPPTPEVSLWIQRRGSDLGARMRGQH
jgi:hypothetical protein